MTLSSMIYGTDIGEIYATFGTYEYKRHRPAPRPWAVFSRAAPRAAPHVAYLVKIYYFSPRI